MKRDEIIETYGNLIKNQMTGGIIEASGLEAICSMKGLPATLYVKLGELKRFLKPYVEVYQEAVQKTNDNSIEEKKNADGSGTGEFVIPFKKRLENDAEFRKILNEEIDLKDIKRIQWPVIYDLTDPEKDFAKKRKIVPDGNQIAATLGFIDYSQVID